MNVDRFSPLEAASSNGTDFVDLHLHTVYSDGRLEPARVVEEAHQRSLSAVAITDHDVVDGLAEAQARGSQLGVEVVAGIELTAEWDGGLAHILGYFIDSTDPQLTTALSRARVEMGAHVRGVLAAARELGEEIDESALTKYRGRYLSGATLVLGMLEQGVLRRSPHGRRLLSMASREPRTFDVGEAIALIHAAGGIASLAHPVRLRRAKPLLEADDLTPLVAAGLDGIEAWQIVQGTNARDHYLRVASELGLVPTGGSDCHGPRTHGMRLGTQRVPAWVLSGMKRRRLSQRAARPQN